MRKIQSVIYVDDDPDICEVVKTTLCMMANLRVYTAASGERAIELALEIVPDLVLMDIMMPGLDGPSTLKRLRGNAALAHIPVIFMTAKLLPAEVAQFLGLGAIGVIGKPFDPLKLCDELFALWSKAGMERAAQAAGGESSNPGIAAKIASLSDTFLGRTAGDVLRLEEIIARIRQGERSLLSEVERLAHRIHGAGHMFGFPQVSASGASIERLAVANTPPSGSNCDPAALRQLTYCTQQLALAVASAQRDESSGGETLHARGSGR
jgi:two-component system, OmpR family, response regulator